MNKEINMKGLSVTGLRERNEDAFHYATRKIKGELVSFTVVADGLGGYDYGDDASKIVVETLTTIFLRAEFEDLNTLVNLIKESLDLINTKILNLRKNASMGSTVVLSIVWGNKLHIMNVGDSRAYLIDTNGVQQISKDHSEYEMMKSLGAINEANEAQMRARSNVITSCLGFENTFELHQLTATVENHFVVILCSDGLWEFINDNELDIFYYEPINDKSLRKLVDLALDRGSNDNITLVVSEYFQNDLTFD